MGSLWSTKRLEGNFVRVERRRKKERKMQIIRLFLVLSVSICSAYGSKFLAIPYNSRSHYFALKKIAEELARRGHDVVLLAFETKHKQEKTHQKLKILTCTETDSIGLHESLQLKLLEEKAGIMETMSATQDINVRMCECILDDEELLKEFKTCDVMINDISLLCGSAIRDLLGIPRVTFFSGLVPPTVHAWLYGIPMPLSYVPHIATGLPNKMNFFQRVGNVMHFSVMSVFLYHFMRSTGNVFKNKYNITPYRDYWESDSDSELVLMQTDFVINYARPLPPGALVIGPLSPEPAKPLPEDLNQFMYSAGPDGVVVVSFGSEAEATVMGDNLIEKMMKAFGQLKQHVLWKFRANPNLTIPQNIKILPWIPQNNLLGHMNTKAFVTHVGHNGMFEAAYHGVPMVGAPLLFDQFDNTRMMEAAGIGIGVDIWSISANELTAAVERVIHEPRSNASRVSRLLKDRRRTPVQEAADHMEFVLRHGGTKHLRPAVLDIPWYQYFLLDVIAFLVVVVTIVMTILVYLVRCVLGCLSRRVLKMKTA